jgi:hypothetical protein
MRYWLARLSFSLLVIAGASGWEAWRGNHDAGKRTLLAIVAAVATGLGLAGLRERHRPQDEPLQHDE